MLPGVLKVLTPPAVEPVTLAEAKTELGITSTTDDARLTRLLTVARFLAESYTNRAFITQTLLLQLDAAPPLRVPWWDGVRQGSIAEFASSEPITLMRAPVVSITSIVTTSITDEDSTMTADDYVLDAVSEPGRVLLKYGKTWPTNLREHACVRITYTAGYGVSGAHVPQPIRDAIMVHVRDNMERPNAAVSSEGIDNVRRAYGGIRVGMGAGTGGSDPTGGLRADAASLLAPYRVLNPGL